MTWVTTPSWRTSCPRRCASTSKAVPSCPMSCLLLVGALATFLKTAPPPHPAPNLVPSSPPYWSRPWTPEQMRRLSWRQRTDAGRRISTRRFAVSRASSPCSASPIPPPALASLPRGPPSSFLESPFPLLPSSSPSSPAPPATNTKSSSSSSASSYPRFRSPPSHLLASRGTFSSTGSGGSCSWISTTVMWRGSRRSMSEKSRLGRLRFLFWFLDRSSPFFFIFRLEHSNDDDLFLIFQDFSISMEK